MTVNLGGINVKKLLLVFLLVAALSGCYGENEGFDRAMALRTSLLNGKGCSFEAQITADFSDKTYTFSVDCRTQTSGDMEFVVQEPAYIAGITGTVAQGSGKLTFDDTALAFPLQGDGVLSPVSGPWVMVKALRSGYVRHCSSEDGLFRMTVNDSFHEDALTLDIWIDGKNGPVRADIYEDNRRIMTITVENFQQK